MVSILGMSVVGFFLFLFFEDLNCFKNKNRYVLPVQIQILIHVLFCQNIK